MNVSHVLSLLNPQTSNSFRMEKEQGADSATDSLLFPFLFSTLLGIGPEAKEQIPEEYLGIQSFPAWSTFLEEITPSQAFYSQNPQEIFPAGKDANSGLGGEQGSVLEKIAAAAAQGQLDFSLAEEVLQAKIAALQSLNQKEHQSTQDLLRSLSGQSVNEEIEPLISLKDFGLEGIKNSISREISSLDPMELEVYRKTMDLLQEFSARIQLVTSGKQAMDNSGRVAYPYPELSQALQEQSGFQQAAAAQGEPKAADSKILPVPGEGHNNFAPGEGGNYLAGSEAKSRQAAEAKNGTKAAQIENQQAVFQGSKTENSGEQLSNSGEKPGSRNDVQLFQTEYQVMTRTSPAGGTETAARPGFVPAETNSLQVWEQVLSVLKKQEPLEVKEMTIQLHPAELGKMHISARWENGQIHLVINASEQSTANILQNHLTDLKNGLSQSGVSCGSLEMGYQDDKEYGSGRKFFPERDSSALRIQDEEMNPYPEKILNFSVGGTGSRINVRA